MNLEELNALSKAEAEVLLRSCCGSSRWVNVMMSRRPFASHDMLHAAADESWDACSEHDWREAFSHHPRIGERPADAMASAEQAGAQSASGVVREELAALNQAYEERFGHIYIVCATGKSAEDMRDLARHRVDNDPQTELRNAAEEQRKITHLRLEKLFGDES